MPKRRFWTTIPITKDVASDTPAAVKSTARAFRVMEFFDEVRRAARANEIADRLGFPQSSTSMLLTSLVGLGYLDYDPTAHTYLPSLRAALLNSWIDKGHFRDGSMMGMLEQLAEDTGLAVSLSTRSGIHVRYLHAIQTREPAGIHIDLSARRYAVWSGAGLMLLAGMPEAEVRALIHRTRAEADPIARNLDTRQVLEFAEMARQRGYFLADGLVIAGVGVIAMRIPDRITGQWQAIALSIAGSRDEILARRDDLIDRMRRSIASLG
jgi:DNA-binding IclR family transcriptional regulator